MSSIENIEALKKENEELRKEIAELNYLLELKEEDLNDARRAVEQMNAMKSKLEERLYAFEQMQLHIEDQQRKAEGLSKREAALEEELISGISVEKSYYQLLESLDRMKAELADANDKLEEIPLLYQERAQLKSRIAALESDLGFALSRNSLY